MVIFQRSGSRVNSKSGQVLSVRFQLGAPLVVKVYKDFLGAFVISQSGREERKGDGQRNMSRF